MPSTRLYIDPQARAVTTKAAASAEASLMQSAATASAEQACSADADRMLLMWRWRRRWRGHAASTKGSPRQWPRGVPLSVLSQRPALTRWTTMNETNAVDLRTVAVTVMTQHQPATPTPLLCVAPTVTTGVR